MNLRHLLRRPHPPGATTHSHPASSAVAREPARGCGWFDSSHELRRGLQVHEHATPDAVAADLPVAHWVDLQLRAWQVTPPA